VKRILTSGLVGTASAAPPFLAHAPWWAVLLAGLAPYLVYVTSLRMTYGVVKRLAERPYPGSFKGACNVELKASSEPASPEPEPLKSKRRVRRKPPPDS
jgi:hypothetical protein